MSSYASPASMQACIGIKDVSLDSIYCRIQQFFFKVDNASSIFRLETIYMKKISQAIKKRHLPIFQLFLQKYDFV